MITSQVFIAFCPLLVTSVETYAFKDFSSSCLHKTMYVCLFVRALDIASSVDYPIFQGVSLKPKVFGIGNTPSTR